MVRYTLSRGVLPYLFIFFQAQSVYRWLHVTTFVHLVCGCRLTSDSVESILVQMQYRQSVMTASEHQSEDGCRRLLRLFLFLLFAPCLFILKETITNKKAAPAPSDCVCCRLFAFTTAARPLVGSQQDEKALTSAALPVVVTGNDCY